MIATCVALPALLATTGFTGGDGRPDSHGHHGHGHHGHGHHGGHSPGPDLSFIDVHQAPEDLIQLSGTPWVVVSSMMGATHPGGLSLIDSRTDEETAMWPVDDFAYDPDLEAFPGCDVPPQEDLAATHGINAVPTGPRTFDLYVVYHGSRESIEVFSLDVRGVQPEMSWRGCVPVPEGTSGNSVVALPDGGIAMTNPADPEQPLLPQLLAEEPSGEVWTWHRERGWTEVPGSDMFYPNGIEASADGATLYVAETMRNRVVSIPTAGGPLTEVARMEFGPDNLRWTVSGTLLTTGSTFDPLTVEGIAACAVPGLDVPDFCIWGFTVVEMDPETGTSETLFHTDTRDFRFPTVAAPVGREIWVGGNAIPRIAVVSGFPR